MNNVFNKDKIAAYVSVLRIDHWVKNLFIFSGIIFAFAHTHATLSLPLLINIVLVFFVFGLIASVNYTINEIVDAPFDRFHPVKKFRAIPAGKVSIRILYGIIALLLAAALLVAYLFLPHQIIYILISFLISGIIYNIPPIRFKDVFVLDVLTESINNPIRFLAGWLILSPSIPPLYFLWAFWALGAFWMAGKRYGEIIFFKQEVNALKNYRKSFQSYTEKNLLLFISLSALVFFCGFLFIVSYIPKLWITVPFLAAYFIWYFYMIFKKHSLVREPETIIKNPYFAAYNIFLAALFFFALFIW